MSNVERINRDFSYHAPKGSAVDRMAAIRNEAKLLALLIDESVPDGREKALAITNLEQVSMWANAGIARNQEPVMTLAEEDAAVQTPSFASAAEALAAIQAAVANHPNQRPRMTCRKDGGSCDCNG